jgi:hypothetical protein
MKPFYFFGRVGDLPGALLTRAVDEFAEQNRKTAALLEGPLRTISLLVAASKYEQHDPRSRAAMNALKRPPIV